MVRLLRILGGLPKYLVCAKLYRWYGNAGEDILIGSLVEFAPEEEDAHLWVTNVTLAGHSRAQGLTVRGGRALMQGACLVAGFFALVQGACHVAAPAVLDSLTRAPCTLTAFLSERL